VARDRATRQAGKKRHLCCERLLIIVRAGSSRVRLRQSC
jgi:hypothetical protein